MYTSMCGAKVWSISLPPLLTTRRSPGCCTRDDDDDPSTRAKTRRVSAPVPNSAPCIVPLCLALLLAQECQAPRPALARVENQIVALSQYNPLSFREREAHSSFTSRVDQAIAWLEKGKLAQAQGDFSQALLWYTQIIEEDGDLALAEYARVGRAISLYEVGDKEEAFVEMEDASLSLKGYPEVHAALAAALYADKNAPLSAEQQFTIATLLDPHYTDLSYVKETKHWPPSLIKSLGKFINLQ